MESTLNSLSDQRPQPLNPGGGIVLDYKRVLFRALRLWYVVALSILIGLTVAYLINRYTTRIYPVTASIIIREPAENTDAKFLYNNPLVNASRNHFNEPYIIRSYPLIQTVIESLNFQVSIAKEGNFKDSEQYAIPLEIDILNKSKFGTLYLKVVSDTELQCFTQASNGVVQRFEFGKPVNCSGFNFVVRKAGDLNAYIGDQLTVSVRNPESVAARYINNLKVSWAQAGSSVVNLDVTGPIPQKEMDFLAGLIEHYHHYDLEKKSQAASRSLVFIDEQLKQIGDSLRLYENALERFKQQNFVTDLSAEASNLYEQLKDLTERRAIISYGFNYYSYLEKYLKEQRDFAQVILPSSIGVEDAVLNSLVTQLIDLQTQLNLLPQSRDLRNPIITDKASRLSDAIAEARSQIIEALSNLRNTDDIRRRGLDQQIRELERQLKTLPITQRALVNIQRNYNLSETMYTYLQQKKAEAGISKASTTSDIVVVNPPRRAGGPITPKILQNYLVFGLSGLFLPFVAFVLLEVLNNKVQSKDDIDKLTDIPFIGGIGHNPIPGNLAVYEKPKSVMAESFRALRSNLNYFTGGKDNKVFVVTSSISGEGKSFTTINLATVFALANKRTVILGADLRKPKIYDDFGLSNDSGLSTYLSGLSALPDVIQKTGIPDLDIISAGPIPPNPSELLLHNRMDELIGVLRQKYDFIFIDTPPLALITDGLVLSKYADHTVFIVRQNYTPRSILKAADDLYTSDKIKNLSIVLNDVVRSGPGYGYGAYGYGYHYGYGYAYVDKDKNSTGYYSE